MAAKLILELDHQSDNGTGTVAGLVLDVVDCQEQSTRLHVQSMLVPGS
jgi:hypothetical protein